MRPVQSDTMRAPIRIALKPGLFRRLDKAIRRRGLVWLQRNLRGQLASTQRALDRATGDAIALSRLHRCNPQLQALRQGLRAERDTLELRLKRVGIELVELEQAS